MSPHHTITPRRTRAGLAFALAGSVAVLGLGAVGVSPASGAGQRAAPVVTGAGMSNLTNGVLSSTGHRLSLGVSATRGYTGLKITELIVTMSRLVHNHTTETHSWDFTIPASAVNLPTGRSGTVKISSTTLGGYGKVNLTIAGKGAKQTDMCGGQPVAAHRSVAITGNLFWNTKSTGAHKWGTVGSARRKFHFSTSSVETWSYQNTAVCPSQPVQCNSSITWSVFKSTATGSIGLSGAKLGPSYVLNGSRTTHLARTRHHGFRLDIIYSHSKPLQLTTKPSGAGTLKVTAGTQSATASSTTSSTSSQPCGTGSKHLQQRNWFGSWKNGTHPLKLQEQVFGPITVPDQPSDASFSKFTVQ